MSCPRKEFRYSQILLSRLQSFAQKGPVNIPTAQRVSDKNWFYIRECLNESEIFLVSEARSNALSGEGRQEFDDVLSNIGLRLFGADWKVKIPRRHG